MIGMVCSGAGGRAPTIISASNGTHDAPGDAHHSRMRRGLTLTELLVVLVIIAIVAAIAAPRIATIADAAAVRDETIRLVGAVDATRGAAVRLDNVASLTITATSYRATVIDGSDTVIAWAQSGPATSGVSITGAGTPMTFGPAGLAMGVSNRTMTLSKGTAQRRVVLSKFGRLTY